MIDLCGVMVRSIVGDVLECGIPERQVQNNLVGINRTESSGEELTNEFE